MFMMFCFRWGLKMFKKVIWDIVMANFFLQPSTDPNFHLDFIISLLNLDSHCDICTQISAKMSHIGLSIVKPALKFE